jgi:hypothetical protein
MKNGMRRTCETCGVIHQNSSTNKCKKCRYKCCGIQVKQDGKYFQCKKKETIEKNYESCFECETLVKIGVKCSCIIEKEKKLYNLYVKNEKMCGSNMQKKM